MGSMDIAFICKALSDPNRLRIVQMLSDGEKCACKLLEEFEVTQPTLSHHMRILCECRLVDVRKEGKWSYYTLNCDTLNSFKLFIGNLKCWKGGESTCE
ncbi:MAG: winged helix-turn-helix transcriptional regulator [Bacteroidales bacterium]|nr:winged helix-turn-helix transcriptional regulator [Bacteroidales bacterium]